MMFARFRKLCSTAVFLLALVSCGGGVDDSDSREVRSGDVTTAPSGPSGRSDGSKAATSKTTALEALDAPDAVKTVAVEAGAGFCLSELTIEVGNFGIGDDGPKLSPDGETLAFGTAEDMSYVYDVEGNQVVRREGPSSVHYAPDGERVFFPLYWQGETGGWMWSKNAPSIDLDYGVPVAFTPDGGRVAASGSLPTNTAESRTVVLDVNTGAEVGSYPLGGPIDPSGRFGASVDFGAGTTSLHDVETGEQVVSDIPGTAQAFSRDGSWLFLMSASGEGLDLNFTTTAWSMEGYSEGSSFEGEYVAASPNGQFIATTVRSGEAYSQLRIWSVSTGEVLLGPVLSTEFFGGPLYDGYDVGPELYARVLFSADSERVAFWALTEDSSGMHVFELDSGRRDGLLEIGPNVRATFGDSDQSMYLLDEDDGKLYFWSLEEGHAMRSSSLISASLLFSRVNVASAGYGRFVYLSFDRPGVHICTVNSPLGRN